MEIDWWDLISNDEKAEIEEGVSQAAMGEPVPHETAMAKYNR